jgi:3-methyladenine DNA glycosylase/8-oxoguanine DNA glycosylase
MRSTEQMAGSSRVAQLALVGAGGEPVDLWRTISSHGVADLPPNRIDDEQRTLEVTVAVARGKPRTAVISQGRSGYARVEVLGGKADPVLDTVRHMLGLDADLSAFYELVTDDPDLDWVAKGAGRMLRSPTVFEEVVKTICTTNCAWSGTVRMVSSLVEHLGTPSAGASPGPFGRTFPTPEAMAEADIDFYRDIARAGYRGAYLRELATSVADGKLDIEAFATGPEDLPDEQLAERLLAIPGVGPYATAHIMMLLGRYSRLVLDSWTRPKYLSVSRARSAKDSTIERRFRRYGPYAGLAFWLYLTRDWVDDA